MCNFVSEHRSRKRDLLLPQFASGACDIWTKIRGHTLHAGRLSYSLRTRSNGRRKCVTLQCNWSSSAQVVFPENFLKVFIQLAFNMPPRGKGRIRGEGRLNKKRPSRNTVAHFVSIILLSEVHLAHVCCNCLRKWWVRHATQDKLKISTQSHIAKASLLNKTRTSRGVRLGGNCTPFDDALRPPWPPMHPNVARDARSKRSCVPLWPKLYVFTCLVTASASVSAPDPTLKS